MSTAATGMKLFTSTTSPWSRKVRVVVQELGLGDAVTEVVENPWSPSPELLAVNPLGRIPVLVTERAEALPDSRLIVDYLMQRKPGPLGFRGRNRWSALRRAQLAEGLLECASEIVRERRRPESIVYVAHMDRMAEKIRRVLDRFEHESGEFGNAAISLAEITAGVALEYLDTTLPWLEWRNGRPGLEAWHHEFSLRPSMMRTVPAT